ncbi:MAG TPA: DUF362 domain-containing protein [Candidatus Limnocylindria bacterium]|nr:DUF362 domain-containing protein [Candidatus Limnocylindria bacterium]
MLERRAFLKGALGGLVAVSAHGCSRPAQDEARHDPAAFPRPASSRVAVLRAEAYDRPLEAIIRDGIALAGAEVAGRRVVVKPNLVEFDPAGVINTHPAVIAATVVALRRLGAREVIVAEGPGHRRDTEYLLDASGLLAVLRDVQARYVDLNVDAVRPVPLRSWYTGLGPLQLPATVLDADLLVSLPKLKTHHWAGVTLSMKNMFGIVPGAVYGWPKNVLHWQGIENSILDINAALTMPRLAVVDGIVGMEGNGPIQGSAKPMGVLVFGTDWVAVDATCARLMELEPARIDYLRRAGTFLGHADVAQIVQVGEAIAPLVRPFAVIDSFAALRA